MLKKIKQLSVKWGSSFIFSSLLILGASVIEGRIITTKIIIINESCQHETS